MNIHYDLPPVTSGNQWVALDTEMFGQSLDHMHRPWNGTFGCLTICPDDENVYFIDKQEMVQEALNRVQGSVWVGQNLKYDITHWRRYAHVPPRKKLVDTMLIERILFNGYYDGFSLQDLSRRYLHTFIDKSIRSTFEGAIGFTPEQIEYACLDALITRKVALEQRKLVTDTDRMIWSTIDLPAMWAFMDFRGFPIDVDAWKTLADDNRARQQEIDDQLPFNPRSPKQVLAWMNANGAKKLKSTGEEELSKLIAKSPDLPAAKMAEMILASRTYGKRASTYGLDFIQDYVEDCNGVNVIVTNYDISRAETSRVSSSNPNMANIPARSTKDFRKCFVAYPGEKIIVADFSAQEPRISAVVSHDEFMLNCFRHGKDIYIELGKQIFQEEITKKDPRRQQMKSLILGIDYGMSEYGLAKRENISTDEAKLLIRHAMEIMPGLKTWMDKQRQETSCITTVPGRKIWLNPYSGQCERNALNGMIQGTASEMAKRALARIHREWPDKFGPFGVVAFVYDEIVASVPEEVAPVAAEFIKTCMEEEAAKVINNVLAFPVEIGIGNSWAEK